MSTDEDIQKQDPHVPQDPDDDKVFTSDSKDPVDPDEQSENINGSQMRTPTGKSSLSLDQTLDETLDQTLDHSSDEESLDQGAALDGIESTPNSAPPADTSRPLVPKWPPKEIPKIPSIYDFAEDDSDNLMPDDVPGIKQDKGTAITDSFKNPQPETPRTEDGAPTKKPDQQMSEIMDVETRNVPGEIEYDIYQDISAEESAASVSMIHSIAAKHDVPDDALEKANVGAEPSSSSAGSPMRGANDFRSKKYQGPTITYVPTDYHDIYGLTLIEEERANGTADHKVRVARDLKPRPKAEGAAKSNQPRPLPKPEVMAAKDDFDKFNRRQELKRRTIVAKMLVTNYDNWEREQEKMQQRKQQLQEQKENATKPKKTQQDLPHQEKLENRVQEFVTAAEQNEKERNKMVAVWVKQLSKELDKS